MNQPWRLPAGNFKCPHETQLCARRSLQLNADSTEKTSRKPETAGVPENKIPGKYARSNVKAELRDRHIHQHERVW